MARRSKNLSIDEQLTVKENEIADLSEQLKTAKSELKALKDEKQLIDSQKIMDAIAASGKSVEEILELINNQ